MKRILSVTVGRSDVSIYLPVWRAIAAGPELSLEVVLAGEHLAPGRSALAESIAREFKIASEVYVSLPGDAPDDIAQGIGKYVVGFSQVYARLAPDWLLVLGDRYEMHAAALAAVPFRTAIAHLHGGEVTHGAIDEAFRHAITKYSHLHFVSTEAHGRRVVQLGEAPWRVVVSGAPALDNLKDIDWAPIAHLEDLLGIAFDEAPILLAFHPVTLEYEQAAEQTDRLLEALGGVTRPILISRPNADTGRQSVVDRLEEFANRRPNARLHDSLGPRNWYSLMKVAAAMVGNSSSGIIEAASFELPVVNVGLRQSGRTRSRNVIDVANDSEDIRRALQLALSPQFRSSLAGMTNVYGSGRAAETITAALRQTPLDERLYLKRFHDLEAI